MCYYCPAPFYPRRGRINGLAVSTENLLLFCRTGSTALRRKACAFCRLDAEEIVSVSLSCGAEHRQQRRPLFPRCRAARGRRQLYPDTADRTQPASGPLWLARTGGNGHLLRSLGLLDAP